jgi:hypothetical protein
LLEQYVPGEALKPRGGVMSFRPLLVLAFITVLFPGSVKASHRSVRGIVTGFNVEVGREPGIDFLADETVYLFRLCHPTQPGFDPNHYFFELFKQAHTLEREIEVFYSEGIGRDPATSHNKLCVVGVKY